MSRDITRLLRGKKQRHPVPSKFAIIRPPVSCYGISMHTEHEPQYRAGDEDGKSLRPLFGAPLVSLGKTGLRSLAVVAALVEPMPLAADTKESGEKQLDLVPISYEEHVKDMSTAVFTSTMERGEYIILVEGQAYRVPTTDAVGAGAKISIVKPLEMRKLGDFAQAQGAELRMEHTHPTNTSKTLSPPSVPDLENLTRMMQYVEKTSGVIYDQCGLWHVTPQQGNAFSRYREEFLPHIESLQEEARRIYDEAGEEGVERPEVQEALMKLEAEAQGKLAAFEASLGFSLPAELEAYTKRMMSVVYDDSSRGDENALRRLADEVQEHLKPLGIATHYDITNPSCEPPTEVLSSK